MTGQSSSAKTATACYIAQTLAQVSQGAEIIVLDIHASDNSEKYWHRLGYQTVVSGALDGVWALWQIFFEYVRREKGTRERARRLIILIDEYEEWLGQVELILAINRVKPQKIKEIVTICAVMIKSFATGGRKFLVTPIVINQSFNCAALRLDKNHTRNFSQIHLNDNAEEFLDRAGAWTPELESFLKIERLNKYRGLVAGTVRPAPLRHPTHWQYEEVNNNQPPMGLVSPLLLPLSVELEFPSDLVSALASFSGLEEIAAELSAPSSMPKSPKFRPPSKPPKEAPAPAPEIAPEVAPEIAPELAPEVAPQAGSEVQHLNRCYELDSDTAVFEEFAPESGGSDADKNAVQNNKQTNNNFIEPSGKSDPFNPEISQLEIEWVRWLWRAGIRAQASVLPRVWGVPRGRGKASLAALEKFKKITRGWVN